jgi:hypothetical protein
MSDFSVYTAGQIVDWLSQGTIDAAPSNIYVALFDDTGSEVSDLFQNDRPSTTAGGDWNETNTGFENATEITFGEASQDIENITEVALYDDSLANGGNELARYALSDASSQFTNAPFDVSVGTIVQYEIGTLNFDVLDRTE